ncbi:hypothetical protein POM88_036821 [Heracleum sosnowskyi]|uniref:F-box associated beta-propeller type 1 domain-containing protein n=1 Tax=Heracleum sosnowskyi TaxID=360622 RepID=A0AAD8MFC9_9APIA|nr:hypothetical protein POM88_036821 [Heracleum sosnowskyi]
MFLLNPTTLEVKKIPAVPESKYCYVYGLGYDISCDDYAIVAVPWDHFRRLPRHGSVSVYMLKTNYWKKVGLFPYDHILPVFSGGFFLNGSLHWLQHSSGLVTAFNIASKEFSKVPKPSGVSDLVFEDFPTLGALKGCLCLMPRARGVTSTTQFWVMKEYGVAESWIKLSIVLTEVRVPWLRLAENIILVLKCGQVVLLVSNVKETEVLKSRLEVIGPPYTSRFGMNFVNSLVSPK